MASSALPDGWLTAGICYTLPTSCYVQQATGPLASLPGVGALAGMVGGLGGLGGLSRLGGLGRRLV